MGRTVRRRVKVTSGASNEAVDALIKVVSENLTKSEATISVRGTFATSVKLMDGNYRTKAISPDMELLFRGMRAGQRSAFIFEFAPVGSTEFSQVEFDEDKIFQAAPEFEYECVQALIGDTDETTAPVTWASAKAVFLRDHQTRLEEQERLREIEREERAAEEKKALMADENWGAF